MKDAFLSIQNVTKRFGSFEAISNFNLNIQEGEFLTILGPSGSGKTTLLKLIVGFEYPDQGQIHIANDDITFKPTHKRNIGMVFQNYALFPHMTAFENIAFPLRRRKYSRDEIRKKVLDILELVRLSGFENRRPNQLSGGQRQRIALARALVFEPRILLLDEPLGALDKNLRIQMQLEIKRLQRELGITTINVTHDQEEALNMSTRVCLLKDGKIEQVGDPKEMYIHPSNLFVATFIGETNVLDGTVEEIHNNGNVSIRTSTGETLVGIMENPLVVGDKVNICIRPENFVQEEKEPNVLRFTISELLYKGNTTLAKVISERGLELQIQLSSKHSERHDLNHEISVSIAPNDLNIFKKGEIS